MNLCILNHRSTHCLGGLHHLILRLPVQPYLGLFGEASSPPIVFTPSLWRGWNLLIGFFTRFIPNTLDLWKKLDDSAPFLRVPLFDIICPKISGGGSKIVGEFSPTENVCASCWGFPSYQYYWRSLLLLPGWHFPPISSGGFLRALPCLKRLPVFSGIQNSWRDCSALARDVLGIIIPAFLSHHSMTKNVSWNLFPAIRRAYFGGRLSS